MAFAGYLIKIGDWEVPLKYMNETSYKGTLSTLDKGSTRDAKGVLHRNAILQVPHCSFTTRPNLTNTQLAEIWSNISSRYTNVKEKKVTATIYITETDSYYTGAFYIPDTEHTIHHIEARTIKQTSLDHNATKTSTTEGNVQYSPTQAVDYKVIYNPITFEFIGYGG